MHVRTRFAPSPTGFLHVGGIRTALFAWLAARQAKGEFILRIEDTDQAREVQGSADHIQECLRWLGLNWDEGPFFQSQRLSIYKGVAQKLVDAGRAYADPYNAEEVEAFREQAKAAKKPFLYREHRPSDPPKWDGRQALRFKSSAADSDDFILIKSDGFPTYNFAHVVDDIEMKVSHVIRGQEFLASTPKYLDLYKALGEKPPAMVFLPHVLGPEGKKKLSKRDGAKDILGYRDEGYLPEAMVSFLATLGWNDGTTQEVFTVDQLVAKFDLDRVQKSGAHFDEQRLNWINGHFIRTLSIDELYGKVADFWPPEASKYDDNYKKQVLALVQERLKYFAELPELSRFFFADLPVDSKLISEHKQLKKLKSGELREMLQAVRTNLADSDFSDNDLTERLNKLLATSGQKPAVLFSLVRIATTQAPASPGLAETMAVLGKDVSLKRVDKQLEHLNNG